jgi:hypothetical protein
MLPDQIVRGLFMCRRPRARCAQIARHGRRRRRTRLGTFPTVEVRRGLPKLRMRTSACSARAAKTKARRFTGGSSRASQCRAATQVPHVLFRASRFALRPRFPSGVHGAAWWHLRTSSSGLSMLHAWHGGCPVIHLGRLLLRRLIWLLQRHVSQLIQAEHSAGTAIDLVERLRVGSLGRLLLRRL